MIDLFHCFGAKPEHRVDTQLAADMLRASGCRYLAVNSHNLATVERGDDLPIGYATATLGSVRALVGKELALEPVLNINHPTTAAEAIARTRRASALTGIKLIKLEVLDEDYRVTVNSEVLEAARTLVAADFEVWPLITPDLRTFRACLDLGATMIRVMGSPIGARRGIDPEHSAILEAMLAEATVPVMLDGGIGSVADIVDAFDRGFDSVLVNSCLFADGADPVARLVEFRATVDAAKKEHSATLQ